MQREPPHHVYIVPEKAAGFDADGLLSFKPMQIPH